MKRALALVVLAGCGARTDLGGNHAGGPGGGDGGCADEIVSQDPKGATALAVDGDVVFWGTTDGLVRMRDAGGTTTTLTTESETITSIAVDSDHVYYAINGSVRSVPRAGGSPAVIGPDAQKPFALAVSGSTLYYLDGGSVEAIANGQTTQIVKGLDAPGGLAVDADYVYVSAALADINGLTYDGPLFRLENAQNPQLLGSHLHKPASLVVFDADVYYVEQSGPNGPKGAGVRKVPIVGGVPDTVLHTDGVLPLDVAADASGVYATVLGVGSSSLVKATSGGAPIALASTADATYGMVRTSPTAIYWTITWSGSPPPDGASVRKLCK